MPSGRATESFITNVEPSVEGFWQFCQERERIRLRKESGGPRPWTDDYFLNDFHFCNIRREHDYGTRWYVENLTGPYISDSIEQNFTKLLWVTTVYRAVNSIEYFTKILGGVPELENWRENQQDLAKNIMEGPSPYSLAHKVLQSPDGQGRKVHLLEHLTWLDANIERLSEEVYNAPTLEKVWSLLQQAPFIGPFISLQIYRDLILVNALQFSDNDFVYLGPGCRSGLELIFPEVTGYKQQYWTLEEIAKLHPPGLELTLGDVEHAMCEYRKWCGLNAGGGRHRFYKPHVAPN